MTSQDLKLYLWVKSYSNKIVFMSESADKLTIKGKILVIDQMCQNKQNSIEKMRSLGPGSHP